MSKIDAYGKVRITLLLDPDERQYMETLAKSEKRSLTGQVAYLIRTHPDTQKAFRLLEKERERRFRP